MDIATAKMAILPLHRQDEDNDDDEFEDDQIVIQ